MRLTILLSVMNLDVKDLDKMNIKCRCVVINQCGKNDYYKYKNFEVYCFDEIGLSNSRNRGLEIIDDGIVLICDNDEVFEDGLEEKVLKEYENKDADFIIFNMHSPARKVRTLKKRKRMHFYNCLNYASAHLSFRRKSVGDIRFNTLLGPGAKYTNGEDSLFMTTCLKNGLKMYSSPIYLGTVYNDNSTWFKGYDYDYIFNKGAIFTSLNPRFRHILMFQYIFRHKEVRENIGLFKAYKIMLKGSKEYLSDVKKKYK